MFATPPGTSRDTRISVFGPSTFASTSARFVSSLRTMLITPSSTGFLKGSGGTNVFDADARGRAEIRQPARQRVDAREHLADLGDVARHLDVPALAARVGQHEQPGAIGRTHHVQEPPQVVEERHFLALVKGLLVDGQHRDAPGALR